MELAALGMSFKVNEQMLDSTCVQPGSQETEIAWNSLHSKFYLFTNWCTSELS